MKLEVFSTSSDSILKLSRGPSSTTSTIFKVGTDSAFVIQNQSDDVLVIKSGNVAIGGSAVTSTKFRIQYAGASTFSDGLAYIDNQGANQTTAFKVGDSTLDNSRYIFRAVNDSDGDVGGPNDVFVIKASGNVGIGTTNPSQKLDVVGYVKGQSGLCIGSDCRTSWPSGVDYAWLTTDVSCSGSTACDSGIGAPPNCPSGWTNYSCFSSYNQSCGEYMFRTYRVCYKPR